MVKVRYGVLVFYPSLSPLYDFFGICKNYECYCRIYTFAKYELIVRRDFAILPSGLVGRIS
jgi:hypothetical protein